MTHDQMLATGLHECASDCPPTQTYLRREAMTEQPHKPGTSNDAPATAAGRALMNDVPHRPWRRDAILADILAIEAEARQAAPLDYEEWVQRVSRALHEDCVLEWRAIAAVDPNRQITMHTDGAHYGQAHDLVRRLNLGGAAAYAAATTDEAPTVEGAER